MLERFLGRVYNKNMDETPSIEMAASEVDPASLEQTIGRLLARGLSHDAIVEKIQEATDLDENGIIRAIRAVYAYWHKIDQELELGLEDLKRWHIRLRLKLLEKSMTEDSIVGYRCALSVLESLASLHGFEHLEGPETDKEIKVILVAAKPVDANIDPAAVDSEVGEDETPF